MNLRELLKQNPVIGIMRNIPYEDTVAYAQVLSDGGIRLFEVALNSGRALEQITLLKKKFGDQIYVGAGTAIRIELAEAAIAAGADFLLTPNVDEEILKYCADRGITLMPGVMTPSEAGICLKYGFDLLKLFPAGDLPDSYVKNVKGPLDQLDFVAIGGVSHANWRRFMENGCVGVGLGSSLVPKELMREKNWEKIRDFILEIYR